MTAESEPVTSKRPASFTAFMVLFLFAFMSKLWSGVVVRQYKIHYIAYAACMLVAGVHVLRRQFRVGALRKQALPLVGFFAYLIASIAWAYSPGATAFTVAGDLLYVFVFALGYVLFLNLDIERLARIYEAIPYGVAAVTIWALAVFGRVRQDPSSDDASQLASISTILAFYVTAALPFVIRRIHLEHRRVSWIVLLGCLVLSLILSSRSAVVINVVVIFIAVLDYDHKRHARVVGVALIAGIVAVVGLVVFTTVDFEGDGVIGRLQHQTTLSFADADEERTLPADERVDIERRLLWLTAYQGFVDHPIVGVGYGSLGELYDSNFGYVVPSHGFVTTLLSETGLIGTAIFCWLMGAYYRRLRIGLRGARSDGEATFHKACRASMIGLLGIGLFHQVYQDQLFYLLLAWGFAAPEIQRVAREGVL